MLLTGNDLKKTMVVKVQNIKEAKSSILNRGIQFAINIHAVVLHIISE